MTDKTEITVCFVVPRAIVATFLFDALKDDLQISSIKISVYNPMLWSAYQETVLAIPDEFGYFLSPFTSETQSDFRTIDFVLSQIPLFKLEYRNKPKRGTRLPLPSGAIR